MLMITQRIEEEVLMNLPSHKGFLIGYIIQDDEESPVFSDVDVAKRYAHENNILTKLGYSIITRLKIASITTDYSSEEVYSRGDVLSEEEYMYYDKQRNTWKK